MLRMKPRQSVGIAAAAFLATGVPTASFGEICGNAPESEELQGAYTVSIGNALLSGGGRLLPLEASEEFPALLVASDGQLILEAGPNSIPFRLVKESEPDWVFDSMVDLQLSSDDFEAAVGCTISELPRLVGGGTAASAEGVPIVYTYRMIVWALEPNGGPAEMIGSLKWSGGGVEVTRVVQFKR